MWSVHKSANIALDGIEEVNKGVRSIRYADDMIIILKPKDNAEKVLEKVKSFLSQRGLEVNLEKTKLTKTTDGFDFL
ncbi:reverse transcriptase domain-containing protein [Moorena sp. SIOASIH]|uniref:reverse transcriptase domain-containing protein n=1 Tax=Moorena sp. SIOASIH TaxID=2607817 RepID=UPI00344E06FB